MKSLGNHGSGGEWLVPPDVAQRAVEWWMSQQSGEMDATAQARWSAWRAENPLHEKAWQRIETVNDRLAGMVQPGQSMLARQALAPRSKARRRAVLSLAAMVFAAGFVWQVDQRSAWRSLVADVRTQRGERRRMTLDDGTQLVINAASALNMDYSADRRRLRLLEGEIFISTAADVHQPARSFSVQTEHGVAVALGTRFNVRVSPQGTQVSVLQGAVRLEPEMSAQDSLVIQAGQQAWMQRNQTSEKQVVASESIAWTDGMLIAKGMPLADMLQALQPYSEAVLRCDPQVAGLRLSGSYPLDRVAQVLSVLSALPELRMETRRRWWGGEEVWFARKNS